MGFENILIVYSEKETENHLNCIAKVEKILGNRIKKKICIGKFTFEDLMGIDLVVVIGGDGTFLRVGHYVDSEFIIGINSDSDESEGELLTLDGKELDNLENILEKNKFEKWERVKIILNEEELKDHALNEVYIGARNQFHTSRYDLCLDGERESQKSSGALIVTPKGSSAWHKSAGGEKFLHGLKYLVREPFIARLSESKLIHGEIKDFISFKSTMRGEGVLVIDSNRIYPFNFGDTVIMKSENKLKVIIK